MGKVLLLDDDRDIIKAVLQIIPELGHEVVISSNYLEGIAYWKSEKFDLIIFQLIPENEINLYPFYVLEKKIKIKKRIRKIFESPIRSGKFWINTIQNMNLGEKIITITKGKIWNVDKLSKQYGIFDHIQKPYRYFDNEYQDFDYEAFKERFTASVLRAFAVFEGIDLTGIIGRDYKLRKAMNGLADASRTNFNVLITGEKGTGKKIFARKIHENSKFKNGPFIVVDCYSIQKLGPNLFPKNNEPIISAITNPGTILFHDIDYMPIDVQTELYNYLHDLTNINIQDSQLSQSRPRIIASASKSKEDLIGKGQFLEDLFNEISFFQLFLPPLRERSNDIPALAEHFVNIHNNRHIENFHYSISKDLLSRLEAYNWPGNITELINVINQAISSAAGCSLLTSVHLPEKIVTSTFKTGSRRPKSYIEKLLSEALKIYENKKEKPAIYKLEDYPWMVDDKDYPSIITEKKKNKPIKSRPKIPTKKPTEDSKDRITIKFYQSGDYWIICSNEKQTMLQDLAGYHFIQFLLKHPNNRFSPEEVYFKQSVIKIKSHDKEAEGTYDELNIRDEQDETFEKLDNKTIKVYKRRIEDLNEKLASDNYSDALEAVEDKQERNRLIILLKKGFERNPKSPHEKARSNVTRAISRALKEIHSHSPEVLIFLNKSTVKTGDKIFYQPISGNEPNWILDKP